MEITRRMCKAKLLMHCTGCIPEYFTDAQKIYWMHGCPSLRIIWVHALHCANSWSVKKCPCFLANQIAGIRRPIPANIWIFKIWTPNGRGSRGRARGGGHGLFAILKAKETQFSYLKLMYWGPDRVCGDFPPFFQKSGRKKKKKKKKSQKKLGRPDFWPFWKL